jgi:hypothetical protein
MPSSWPSSGESFYPSKLDLGHMEIWQIVAICLLMVPVFLLANYLIVKKMARQRRERDERIERAAAESVARSFRLKGQDRYLSWPRYNPRRKG